VLETLICVVSMCNIFVNFSCLMGQGTGNVEDVLPDSHSLCLLMIGICSAAKEHC
jgi:hypothetical protein